MKVSCQILVLVITLALRDSLQANSINTTTTDIHKQINVPSYVCGASLNSNMTYNTVSIHSEGLV